MEWSKNDPSPGSKCKPPSSPKSPSRLQKHAPAALHLDGIKTTGSKVYPCSDSSSDNSSSSSSSPPAIPLLSPIPLVSPLSQSPPCEAENITGEQLPQSRNPVIGGWPWQHPATTSTSLAEPSKLYSLFQTQCSLVDSTQ